MQRQLFHLFKNRKLRVQVLAICMSGILVISFQNCKQSQFEVASFGNAAGIDMGSSIGGGGSGTQPTPGGAPPALPPPVAMGSKVTEIKIENTTSTEQKNVPFTFGHTFYQGAISDTMETLAGQLSDGTALSLQVETKAKHADKSIRHAIITGILPVLPAGQTVTMSLMKAAKPASGSLNPDPMTLVNAGFGATITIDIGGTQYQASLSDGLKSNPELWLKGPLVNDWILNLPFKTSSGIAHPHLTARCTVRAYTGLNRAKIDIVVENGWAYEPGPQNLTYNVTVNVGGQNVYSKTALNHYHHARWKKTFWWGEATPAHVKLNTKDLILSRAFPNYDPSIVVDEATIARYYTGWLSSQREPMQTSFVQRAMATTGGRPDIGLHPAWHVVYLLSQDRRMKEIATGLADLAGSWPIHYRDQITDRPLSIKDWPYAGLIGNAGDKVNPATKQSEAFPVCGGDCSSPNQPDLSHQPNLNFIPYVLTGDYYYLQEMGFWAAYNLFNGNPHYRKFDLGLLSPEQVRGQAWGMRIIGQYAYILPDSDPFKSQAITFVENNIKWYHDNYVAKADAPEFGFIINGYSLVYNDGLGLAPWQDDFFTSAIGHLVELGYNSAKPLLSFKSKFPILRLTAPGMCWIDAPMYSMNVRASKTGPFYATMAEVYKASIDPAITSLPCGGPEMAAAYKLKVGEMPGYSSAPAGFPSNMQPAIAYAATSGVANGPAAWQVFMNRSVKPNYTSEPQFAIVPRQ